MARNAEIFTCNRFLGQSTMQQQIAEYIQGKTVISMDVKQTAFTLSSTIVVEDEPKNKSIAGGIIAELREPNSGKGYGRSRYRGVSWDNAAGKWRAMLSHKGDRHHLGRYDNEYEAALAYDAKARELMGPAAYTNFDY